MGYVRLTGDAIWARGIEGDRVLQEEILGLPAGELIELEIEGTLGSWEKMKDGRDGRRTPGIRPVGPMRSFWRSMQNRRGDLLRVRRIKRVDPYLAFLQSTLEEEWNSAEDDEAFRDL